MRRRRPTAALYARFASRGDLCFDVGAHVGERTQALLLLGARVICVEPQEVCVRVLRQRFGHRADVIIVDKAAGPHNGDAALAVCDAAPAISTLSNRWRREGRFHQGYHWTSTQRVSMVTLDSLIAQYGVPQFCKVDVEGFEPAVFQGLTHPIDVMAFEFTRELFDDTKRCVAHLEAMGQMEFNCSIAETMRLLWDEWVTSRELYARVNAMQDPLLWGDVYARFLASGAPA